MNGTSTAVVTSVTPGGRATVTLSPESRARLNFLGQAWVRAKVELATLRVAPDYTWVDTLVKQANGEKLTISTITQGFTAGTVKEKELKGQQEALREFAAGTLDRIRAVVVEAPDDAKVVLTYWLNELVARTTEISTQASSLTAGFTELSGLVGDGTAQSNSAASLAELQQSVSELNQLIAIITAAAGASEGQTQGTHVVQLAQANEEAVREANLAAQRARREAARARSAAQKARATAKEQVRQLRRELRQVSVALRKTETRAARAEARAAAKKK